MLTKNYLNSSCREAERALLSLGYSTEVMDDMAASVCEEVKRLGTVEAITTQVLHAQQKERTDFVLSQNQPAQTARDYLNDIAK